MVQNTAPVDPAILQKQDINQSENKSVNQRVSERYETIDYE